MSVGNVFAPKKLFQRREPIDYKRFVEIYQNFDVKGKDNKSYLPLKDGSQRVQLELMAKTYVPILDRDIYTINTIDFVPPRCVIREPFEVFYDEKTKKLYASPQDCGIFRFMIEGQPIEINGSNLFPIKKQTVVGCVELEAAEYFRNEEYI